MTYIKPFWKKTTNHPLRGVAMKGNIPNHSNLIFSHILVLIFFHKLSYVLLFHIIFWQPLFITSYWWLKFLFSSLFKIYFTYHLLCFISKHIFLHLLKFIKSICYFNSKNKCFYIKYYRFTDSLVLLSSIL